MSKNLTQIHLDFSYHTSILLPFKESAQLLALLEKAQIVIDTYGGAENTIRNSFEKNEVVIKPYCMTKYQNILTAQTLGVSYKNYMEELEKAKGEKNAE